mmetsp:Transcript_12735/g.32099  ORF Transcript_12735/g.32099 Transcript_12735/m.32099 type:complete len:254 (-) Transcript_12735:2813-3574(-)
MGLNTRTVSFGNLTLRPPMIATMPKRPVARNTTKRARIANSTKSLRQPRTMIPRKQNPCGTRWANCGRSNLLSSLVSSRSPNPRRDTLSARRGSKRRFSGWKRPTSPPPNPKRNSPRNSSGSATAGSRMFLLHGPTPTVIYSASIRTCNEAVPKLLDRTASSWTRRAGRFSASSIPIRRSLQAFRGNVSNVSWRPRLPAELKRTVWNNSSRSASCHSQIRTSGDFTREQEEFPTTVWWRTVAKMNLETKVVAR